MVADYYLVKRQHIVLEDLYTMSKDGSLYFENGWNRRALIALAIAGSISVGLSLLGAYGVIASVGDWGWLIGATLGALLYTALMRSLKAPSLSSSGATV
jgi:NCS1 family nucleobase:cation symporter-1